MKKKSKIHNYYWNPETKLIYINVWDKNFEKYYLIISKCETPKRRDWFLKNVENGTYILYLNTSRNKEMLLKNGNLDLDMEIL